MKNVHRLSLMVLTVLTAAFLAVDLPLMAQMGGQQQGRGQQRAPQQQKGAQQGAPRGAGTAQFDKSSPKLSPQQEQRVGQLRQQAQSLFRNLQQVLGELQRLPKPGTQGLGGDGDPIWLGGGTDFPVGQPNPRGPQQRPGQQRGFDHMVAGGAQEKTLAESDDPDGATSNPSGGVVDGDRIAQTGRNDAAFIKFDGLKQQARQVLNNLEGIGKELKGLGFTKQNFTILQSGFSMVHLRELQQMVKELKEFGVAVPAESVFFQEFAIQDGPRPNGR